MPGAKILIIDDSTELRSLLESILPYSGYQTISATTGQDGLDLAEKIKPDLILLDLELPDTTGLKVLEALERQARSIPTIMMTGYGSAPKVIWSSLSPPKKCCPASNGR
jgi:DNA-binding response OmpR family regulator